jgi:hypothetical protein
MGASMRPVDRGKKPAGYDPDLGQLALGDPDKITDYKKAKQFLVDVLGPYCSYCERRIPTLLAVEHVLPKSATVNTYAHLALDWNNFLLGCVNCNSKKKDYDSDRTRHLWPDEHNTFLAFQYEDTGLVKVNNSNLTTQALRDEAQRVLDCCGLNLNHSKHWKKKKGKQGALERFGQRSATITEAKASFARYKSKPSKEMAEQIASTAVGFGFFSIWLDIFESEPDVKVEILRAYKLSSSKCFDQITGDPLPHPTGRC